MYRGSDLWHHERTNAAANGKRKIESQTLNKATCFDVEGQTSNHIFATNKNLLDVYFFPNEGLKNDSGRFVSGRIGECHNISLPVISFSLCFITDFSLLLLKQCCQNVL